MKGHYLTPASIARFMAEGACYSHPYLRVLDPGERHRSPLGCSVRSRLQQGDRPKPACGSLRESSSTGRTLTRLVLTFSRQWLDHRGIDLTFDVRQGDFVLEYSAALEADGKSRGPYSKAPAEPPPNMTW